MNAQNRFLFWVIVKGPLSQSEPRMDYKRFPSAAIQGSLKLYKETEEGEKKHFRFEWELRTGIVLGNKFVVDINMDIQILLLIAIVSSSAAEMLRLESVDSGPPQPYNFGYEVHDNHGDQWRSEVSDGFGHVHGSYGFVDSDGMRREVKYVADNGGFRAHIKTNEPGMDMPNPADVVVLADPPSDYDASVYGLERIPPRHPAQVRSNSVENPRRKFYKQHKFTAPAPPPIYVVDGHVQSPWFPMDTVANV
ncbi:uncharacterized protein CDAR_80901 [Caerostris darwini]|uniref:Uncharacterized protein n=1 Tax=Caerostris darwini TaxID=1538125 RepID=A0AAV4SET5_9ARAC|nr:uncharacterized protein CDAR_80901 [Caerostris darwini]